MIQLWEIEQALAHERTQSQLAVAKKELEVLAKECNKAFIAAGLEESRHPQIRKALDLCASSISPSHKVECKEVAPTSAFGEIWKRDAGSAITMDLDTKEMATSILGKNLVDTLTEADKQPPDVSMLSSLVVLSTIIMC